MIPIFTAQDILQKLATQKNSFYNEYYAFYSSWLGGIVTDPHLMLVPIDDHMVHRGDGVFEAMKAINRSVYLMDEHLHRLAISADKIALKLSFSMNEIKEIVLDTLRVANQQDAIIRIFLSRGPGSFSVNPYDSIAAQLYVVITKLSTPSVEKYTNGVIIGKSTVCVKSSLMAQVKSCNYLPNVLMKKEAVDRGFDFMIGVDTQGFITECPTENVFIVDPAGTIVYPTLNNILKGTTMVRACELAHMNGIKIDSRPISITDLQSAREVMIAGTSLNILPVVRFENITIGDGKPGPVAKKLNQLMIKDIEQGMRGTKF